MADTAATFPGAFAVVRGIFGTFPAGFPESKALRINGLTIMAAMEGRFGRAADRPDRTGLLSAMSAMPEAAESLAGIMARVV